jgi:hypothetical protein
MARRLLEKNLSWVLAFVAVLAISIITSTGVSAGGGDEANANVTVGTLTVTITPTTNLVVHEIRVTAEGEDITIKELKVQLDQNPLTGVRLWEGGKVIGSGFVSSGLTVTFFVNVTVPKDSTKALAVTTDDTSAPLKLKSVDVVGIGVDSGTVITVGGGNTYPAHNYCKDRFHYTAFLQGVSVEPGKTVRFPDCEKLSMKLTFRGSEIKQLSWTQVLDESGELIPALSAVIVDGPNAVNFRQQYIPEVTVAIKATTDPTLQALIVNAFGTRSNETVFSGSTLIGFGGNEAGDIQIFTVWIDVGHMDVVIPLR